MSKFVETEYGSTREILKFPDHYVALAVMVDDTGVSAVNGKKIVPKGTIIGGKENPVLTALDEPVADKFVAATEEPEAEASADGAEGVLLNDVDVTHGPKEGAMIIHGFVAIDKLPYGDDNEEAVEAAGVLLPMVKFIK